MANLLSQNIGQNYKGILNLGAAINTPLDGTLRAVTDGEGNASPLQLSTTQVNVAFTGTSTANNQSIFSGSGTFTSRATASDTLRFGHINSVLTSTALSQTLIGLDVSPTFNSFNDNTVFVGYRVSSLTNTQNNSAAFWASQTVGANNSLSIRPQNSRWQIVFNASSSNLTSSLGGSIVLGGSGVAIQPNGASNDATNVLDVIGNAFIGGAAGIVASARLHVRGDGTNPAVRIDGGASQDIQRWYWSDNTTLGLSVNSVGNIVLGQGVGSGFIYGGANSSNYITIARGGYHIESMVSQPFLDYNAQSGFHQFKTNNNRSTSGTGALIYGQSSFVPSGNSTTNPRGLWIDYTLNRNGFTASGTATGIFLNATETDITGMTHNLMDLGTGGGSYVSKFKVDNAGTVTATNFVGTGYFGLTAQQRLDIGTSPNRSNIQSTATGRLLLRNAAEDGFDMLQFGGTSVSFPAIKRNGAAIDFRLADDSAYCDINAKFIYADTNMQTNGYLRFGSSGMWLKQLDNSNMGLQKDNQGTVDSVRFGGLTDVGILMGTGSPESVKTAPVGSLFLRTDGGALSTLYVKESGTGNTGWVAK